MGAALKMAPTAPEQRTEQSEEILSVRAQRESGPLYANRVKVYPKRVRGTYRRIKWAVLILCLTVYYVAPWLRWDRGPVAPSQALLIDLPGRRAYFFGLEIWPQEVYYLTGLLILAAIGLFLVTSLFGRLWCGYACPQTVWTDLFMWVERLIEGDRNARMRLDQMPLSLGKAARKTFKHGVWLLIAAATGGAWILYFQDAPTALRAIFIGQASIESYFFVGLFTTTTYLLAGWAREQVCTYMCPWPRFQAAMLDESSLVVTYRKWRGEPRAKHKQGASWEGRGDCIDCGQCVAACPTGIDIRDGQQLECIGCGLCIDACDSVMDKVGRPRRLIAFATLASQNARGRGESAPYRLLRPRVVIYAAVLAAVAGVMSYALLSRATLGINVLHERTPLYTALSGGAVRNGYTVKIINKQHVTVVYALSLEGLPQVAITAVGVGAGGDAAHPLALRVEPDSVATYRLYVTLPEWASKTAEQPVTFLLRSNATGELARHQSIFIGPGMEPSHGSD